MISKRHPTVSGRQPVRTCLGCRERTTKDELLRVVAGSDSDGRAAVVPDAAATAPGRGAYVHPRPECVAAAVRRRALTRALRAREGLTVRLLEEDVAARTEPSDRPRRSWSSSS